jgi:hypothetical protein
MTFTIEFFRIRERDNAHVMLDVKQRRPGTAQRAGPLRDTVRSVQGSQPGHGFIAPVALV